MRATAGAGAGAAAGSAPGLPTEAAAGATVEARPGGRALGRVYLDMHPREGKYKHYAQFTLAAGVAGKRLPEGVLVCNFPRPGAVPALLEHAEVKTFLHELGHLLHHVLGGHVRWAAQSGVATEWDFVEAPSQMLEEWAWDPEILAGFARHVETGEPIPADLVRRMRVADGYGKGLQTRQQMFYAALSLELHRRPPGGARRRGASAPSCRRPTRPSGPCRAPTSTSPSGTSRATPPFTTRTCGRSSSPRTSSRSSSAAACSTARPRCATGAQILEPGGSRPAAELVRAFLGRDFSFEAFQRWLEGA